MRGKKSCFEKLLHPHGCKKRIGMLLCGERLTVFYSLVEKKREVDVALFNIVYAEYIPQ